MSETATTDAPAEGQTQTTLAQPASAAATVVGQSQAGSTLAKTDNSANDEPAAFDATSIEDAFGLPAGALKDVKDMDNALSAVREFTDKVTVAGVGLESPFGAKPAAKPTAPAAPQSGQPATKPAEGQPQYMTRADLDSYYAEKAAEQESAQTAAMLAELDRRLDAEIDSWASTKYGVGKQRNVKQLKAHNDLKSLIVTHIAGAAATGQALPQGEVVARRVRLIDDESYKPGAPAQPTTPLGTPGAAKAANAQAKEGPRNIHEAVLGRKI